MKVIYFKTDISCSGTWSVMQIVSLKLHGLRFYREWFLIFLQIRVSNS